MTMEYAGAVEVTPPFRASAQDWVRGSGWTPSREGDTIRPRAGISLDACLCTLRDLVSLDAGKRSYTGMIAAYDPNSRELVTVTVRDGRVTRRTVSRSTAPRRSNVIELAARRRAESQAI